MLSSLAVRVAYQGERKAYHTEFNIYAIFMDKIIVYREPNKVSWRYDDAIDYTGLIVRGVYNNDDTEVIASGYTVTPTVFNGESSATITYNGFSCSFALKTIRPARLVVTPSNKSYEAGEATDYSDVVVRCVYTDGSSRTVTEKCVFDPPAGTTVTRSTQVRISYTEGGYTVSTSLPVRTKYVTHIGIDRTNSQKTNIRTGSDVDYSDIQLIAYYNDGSTKIIKRRGENPSSITYSTPHGSKLRNPRQRLTASYTTLDESGLPVEFTIPLNEPELESIEPMAMFVAPIAETVDETDYPMFTIGWTDFKPSSISKFIQGTLIVRALTLGTYSEGAYTEDYYGNKFGRTINISMLPHMFISVWLIDPRTGKRMGFQNIPFNYEAPQAESSPSPEWEQADVWGWDVPTWEDYVAHRNLFPAKIHVIGPVYYDAQPSRDITSVRPIIKDGKISWGVTTKAIQPNQDPIGEEIVEVEDLPEGIEDWLKLAEAPSNLVSCDGDTATFEYTSDGQTYRTEISMSKFNIPPSYSTCSKIYTYSNVSTVVRDSQTVEHVTELLHVARFTSPDDDENAYYVTFKSTYSSPIVETVAMKALSISDRVTYNPGDTMDYQETKFVAEYSDGSQEVIPYTDVSLDTPQGSSVVEDMEINANYTNEAGETASSKINPMFHKLSRLIVTPPTKLNYYVFDTIDYTGLSAVVEYTNGTTQDVTYYAKVSSKSYAYIVPEMDKVVTVSYTEGRETIKDTFELNIGYWGIYINQYPNKRLYRIGDTIDYTGLRLYSDGKKLYKEDLTFSVPEGTVVTPTTDELIEMSYEQWDRKYSKTLEIFIVGKDYSKRIDHLEVASPPSKVDYNKGDILVFTGLRIMCHYTDGTSANITTLARLNAEAGARVDGNTPRTVTAKYSEEYSGEFSTSFDLNITLLDRLAVTPPTRLSYQLNETLRFSDLGAVCYYVDGSYADVSDLVTCSPSKGTKVTEDTPGTVTVSYTESGETVTATFTILI